MTKTNKQWIADLALVRSKIVQDTYGTRTPAVKSRVRDVAEGPVSYVARLSYSDAVNVISTTTKMHQARLLKLQAYATGRDRPETNGNDYQHWQYYQGKVLQVTTLEYWAQEVAIPDEERYLLALDRTLAALRWLARRWVCRTKAANEER